MSSWPKGGRPERHMYPNEVRSMEECGFYIHHVPLSRSQPYINAHTHGVPESWEGQLDFQIVVNIGPESCYQIFWDLVDRTKEGERFKDGDRVHEILKQPVLLKEVWEGRNLQKGYAGRKVLRILLPDSRVDPATLPGDEGHDPEFFPLQETLDTEHLPWDDIPGHRDVPDCDRGED